VQSQPSPLVRQTVSRIVPPSCVQAIVWATDELDLAMTRWTRPPAVTTKFALFTAVSISTSESVAPEMKKPPLRFPLTSSVITGRGSKAAPWTFPATGWTNPSGPRSPAESEWSPGSITTSSLPVTPVPCAAS
jgi:hypothetical protein